MNIGICGVKGLLRTHCGPLRVLAILLCIAAGLGLPEVGYAGLGSTTIADIARSTRHSPKKAVTKKPGAAVRHSAGYTRRPTVARSRKRSEGRALVRRTPIAKRAVIRQKTGKAIRIRSVRPPSRRGTSRPSVSRVSSKGQWNTKPRVRGVVWSKPVQPSAETIFVRYLSMAESELKSRRYLRLSTAQELADAAKSRISPISGAVAANDAGTLTQLATGIKLAERAASLNPDLSDAYMWQVQGYVHARCESSALRISETAMNRFPDDQYFKNTISRIRRFRACR